MGCSVLTIPFDVAVAGPFLSIVNGFTGDCCDRGGMRIFGGVKSVGLLNLTTPLQLPRKLTAGRATVDGETIAFSAMTPFDRVEHGARKHKRNAIYRQLYMGTYLCIICIYSS